LVVVRVALLQLLVVERLLLIIELVVLRCPGLVWARPSLLLAGWGLPTTSLITVSAHTNKII